MSSRTIVRPIVSAIVRGITPAPPPPAENLGPDLAVSGDFSSETGWSLGAGWTISGGLLIRTEPGGSSSAIQAVAGLIPGSTYRIRFTVASASGTDNRLLGRIYGGANVSGPLQDGVGVYQQDLIAPASPTGFLIFAVAGFAGTIDNLTFREVNPGS